MSFFNKGLLVFCSFALVLGLTSCKEKGAGEKLGKKLDKAVEQAGQAAQDAGKQLEKSTSK